MAEKKKNMLFIGGAGYIGGPIMSRFLERPDSNFNITTLVRPSPKAAKLQARTTELPVKIEVVIGSHKELDLVERLSANSDVVFSLADSDDLPPIEAILRGLKKRFKETGVKPDVIHMSGTGCTGDGAEGMFSSDIVYNDMDIAQIESLKPTQSHRDVDLAIVEADTQGYVNTYIILPGAVYGTPGGVLARAGIQNATNLVFTTMLKQSILRGGAIILGEGKNITTSVDVNEIADFMELLFDSITSNQAAHGRNGYYFLVNGDATFDEIASVIEDKAGPRRPVTQAELAQYYPGRVIINRFFGDNCRAVAKRARAMGWKPIKTAEDFLNALRDEIVAM
ncbi:hypothetical protein C8J56DRAFT_888018 [Mycena floridula]|nr:hypothetical protein C8J56DRAFT_888018 [Mycena floridula]